MVSQSQSPIYLSGNTLEELGITSLEVVQCMEQLIRTQARGKVWHTPKSVIQPGDGRYMMSTLSAADDPRYLAVKSVVLNPDNPNRGLPQINGLIMLLSSDTGLPLAVVDGNWVTAIRTAGASAVVARRLALPESKSIAFIGCGVQAHSHLRLFADLFALKELHAYGRGEKNRRELCKAGERIGLVARDHNDPKVAVEDADIIISSVTLTHKIDPFVDPHWLKPGAFVSSTDTAIPLDPKGMDAFDGIIIDDREQEAAMAEPMVDPALITGDILGLVNDQVAGRTSDTERHAFVFRAVALGDLALSGLAYDKARETGKGQQLA